jgi:hypothetical protein
MNGHSCELSHFHGQFHDSDCMAKQYGRRAAGFHSTIISLILAEVGSTRNRAVDQCGQAEALDQSNGTAGREEYIGGHPQWAESAAKSGSRDGDSKLPTRSRQPMVELKSKTDQRITFSLFASPPHAGFDVPCSMLPSHEIL